ncbi:ABC transporter ATP-binding protein [Altericista sp. CCNU0014]|uniref:ABC transporter ATP-binding protein n=1 Tax=Altericista sp. CCNU0014 TaxID=3082949 RepID=UPI00384DFFA3
MIEVEHLSKIYGSTTAINDVTFRAEPGEILGLLGPNGAGKTTTMRILSGYLPASDGTARVAGYEVHESPMAVRQRIGYLPETPPLYTEMTVEDYLNFVARIKGVAAGDRAIKIASAIKRCNLQEKRKVHIRKLSKGFRQRVGIAQAIVHDPPAIILDEPTVGLDPRQIIEVRNLIKNLGGQTTAILSTHILPEVSMTCDRVAIINRGCVVSSGTPEDLMLQLSGGMRYELEVEGDRGQIAERLQRVADLSDLDWLAADGLPAQRHRLRVSTETNADFGKQLAEVLVSEQIGLYEMRRVGASLEDVFLQLTTEEKAVDSASEIAPAATPAEPTQLEPASEQSEETA